MNNLQSEWTDGLKRVAIQRGGTDGEFYFSVCIDGTHTYRIPTDEDTLRQAQVVIARFVEILDGQAS